VFSLIASKGGVKYAGRDLDAMKAVAQALQMRSLNQFQGELVAFKEELEGDEVVNHHIKALYETMLEQHLCRCIEPFSKVELTHIASLVGLPQQQVLDKLSQMILDKKFEGTLDQGSGCLLIFEENPLNELYQSTLEHFQALNSVVDSLFEEALVANSS
jgi:26S proteasome regulatory subunit N6